MKSTFANIALVAMGLAAIQPLQAAVSITVHATAMDSGYGYILGDSYSFTCNLSDSFADSPANEFQLYMNHWTDIGITPDPLYSSVIGTGVTGAYIPPATPNTSLKVATNGTKDAIEFTLISQNTSDVLGLLAPDGTTEITVIGAAVGLNHADTGFSFSGFYSDPSIYLADYFGTYNATGDSILGVGFGSKPILFQPTSLEIAEVSAVPETATTLPTMALVAGGLLIRRRSFGRRM